VSVTELATGLETMSSALPEAVNYHRWILDLIRPYLGGRLLEVGFGYGQYTREMAGAVEQLLAVDLDPGCLAIQDSLPANVRLMAADAAKDRFVERVGEGEHDVAVCLNVLEHIEDDVAAVGRLGACLRPGGRLLVLVPAHPALYGPMDRMAGHFRRYRRSGLADCFARAGLELRVLGYVNPLGGIGWWVNARFGQPRSLSDTSINRQILWFDRYVQPLSRRLTPLTSRWFGQSLWAVGENS
jgi:SAM-dependent methyltransferase